MQSPENARNIKKHKTRRAIDARVISKPRPHLHQPGRVRGAQCQRIGRLCWGHALGGGGRLRQAARLHAATHVPACAARAAGAGGDGEGARCRDHCGWLEGSGPGQRPAWAPAARIARYVGRPAVLRRRPGAMGRGRLPGAATTRGRRLSDGDRTGCAWRLRLRLRLLSAASPQSGICHRACPPVHQLLGQLHVFVDDVGGACGRVRRNGNEIYLLADFGSGCTRALGGAVSQHSRYAGLSTRRTPRQGTAQRIRHGTTMRRRLASLFSSASSYSPMRSSAASGASSWEVGLPHSTPSVKSRRRRQRVVPLTSSVTARRSLRHSSRGGTAPRATQRHKNRAGRPRGTTQRRGHNATARVPAKKGAGRPLPACTAPQPHSDGARHPPPPLHAPRAQHTATSSLPALPARNPGALTEGPSVVARPVCRLPSQRHRPQPPRPRRLPPPPHHGRAAAPRRARRPPARRRHPPARCAAAAAGPHCGWWAAWTPAAASSCRGEAGRHAAGPSAPHAWRSGLHTAQPGRSQTQAVMVLGMNGAGRRICRHRRKQPERPRPARPPL